MIEGLLILLILTDLLSLGYSRLSNLIKMAALQGVILGLFTLGIHAEHLTLRIFLLFFSSLLLKGFLFPWFLMRIMRSLNIQTEVEPLIGYSSSLFLGALFFGLSWWMGHRLHFTRALFSEFIIPAGFFTLFTGAFLMVSRAKAITQVIGYLLMENGIYLVGIALLGETDFMVELGVLLDITVGIFITQIILHHIRREFDSLNINKLSLLKDWEVP